MSAKKNNKVQNNVQNQQVNNNGCQHVQLGGMAVSYTHLTLPTILLV